MHNRWLALSLAAGLLLALLAACGGPAASAVPTSAPVPTPAATAAPAAIPTAAPMAAPTAAPTEAATAAPAPTEPAATDQIVGVWTRFSSADGAPIFLAFGKNGTFRGSIGPDYAGSATSFTGAYELTNDMLLVTNSGGSCGEQVGTYRPEFQGNGQFLFFNPADEPCSERGFEGRWQRFTP